MISKILIISIIEIISFLTNNFIIKLSTFSVLITGEKFNDHKSYTNNPASINCISLFFCINYFKIKLLNHLNTIYSSSTFSGIDLKLFNNS